MDAHLRSMLLNMQFPILLRLMRQVWAWVPRYRRKKLWDVFHSNSYLDHTARRLEHLSSLQIDFDGKTVLEFGAGIGDLTGYFVSRSCKVSATDSRPELVELLQSRFQDIQTSVLDLEKDFQDNLEQHQVVFAYGVLYHVSNPERALSRMSNLATEMLILETCVSVTGDINNVVPENSASFSQATSGLGSRPNREDVFNELKKHFSYVYLPITQPRHSEFPLDWEGELPLLSRAIFVCSRDPMNNLNLSQDFLKKHAAQV